MRLPVKEMIIKMFVYYYIGTQIACMPYVNIHTKIKDGHVLFNDAVNTFYLWLYGDGRMVKDHSNSERENQLPPTWATLSD